MQFGHALDAWLGLVKYQIFVHLHNNVRTYRHDNTAKRPGRRRT
jgi:hypothetical protein